MDNLLELRNVSKTFPGVKALQNVNLDLRPGEILGLCGENGAGKSTLMKILTGIYHPDPGAEIYLEGKQVHVNGVNHARDLGLCIIHQELNVVNDLTVAQNLFLGRKLGHKFGYIYDDKMNQKAAELFERFGMKIDPKAKMGSLTVARQQMVEIAKALSYNARILVMDEPTAALTLAETDALYELIRGFISPTTGVIFISHRMAEIKELTDRVTVLRDGQYIGTAVTNDVDLSEIISMMVGREVPADARPRTNHSQPDVALKVEGLEAANVHDVSFEVHKGEILGFSGLVGAGRTETARALFGADPHKAGTITINGKAAKIHNCMDAVKAGLCYLSEDRKRYGALLDFAIDQNVALSSMGKFTKGTVIDDKKISSETVDYVEKLHVRTPSAQKKLGSLSGGNQQKVIIAKWLLRDSDVMIFDEPTRGIDVGAKEEIYQLLEKLAEEGRAIVVISSELPEILRISNRIAVMAQGRITGFLDNAEATQENIMELATVGKPVVIEGDAQ